LDRVGYSLSLFSPGFISFQSFTAEQFVLQYLLLILWSLYLRRRDKQVLSCYHIWWHFVREHRSSLNVTLRQHSLQIGCAAKFLWV